MIFNSELNVRPPVNLFSFNHRNINIAKHLLFSFVELVLRNKNLKIYDLFINLTIPFETNTLHISMWEEDEEGKEKKEETDKIMMSGCSFYRDDLPKADDKNRVS